MQRDVRLQKFKGLLKKKVRGEKKVVGEGRVVVGEGRVVVGEGRKFGDTAESMMGYRWLLF